MWIFVIAIAALLYVLNQGLGGSVGAGSDSNAGDTGGFDMSSVTTAASSAGKALFGIPQNVSDLIDKYAAMYGVDPTLAKAQAWAESRGKQFTASGSVVTSKTGALGVFQLEPSTAAGLGVDPSDLEQNIQGGVLYLKQMLTRFGGNVSLALAAYNAGPGNVLKYGGIPPFAETQNYVKSILAKIGG